MKDKPQISPEHIDSAIANILEKPTEPVNEYLEFALSAMNSCSQEVIEERHRKELTNVVSGWEFDTLSLSGNKVQVAVRSQPVRPVGVSFLKSLSEKSHRLMGQKEDGNITMAAVAPMLGADIIALLRIEHKFLGSKFEMLPPERKPKMSYAENVEIELVDHEKKIVNLLAHGNKEATNILGQKEKYISTALTKIQKRHAQDRRRMLESAFRQDLIDLSPLPEVDWLLFESSELDIYRNFLYDTDGFAADKTDYSLKDIKAIWKSISKKTDIPRTDTTRLHLLALRDGLIEINPT